MKNTRISFIVKLPQFSSFLARATSLYKSLFCPSVVRPSSVRKFFLGFWLVDNGNVTSSRRSLRLMSSTKATYLLLQKYKTHNKRLSWAVPHSELNEIKIIPVFVVLALCTIKIDHIRARAIDHSVLFYYKVTFLPDFVRTWKCKHRTSYEMNIDMDDVILDRTLDVSGYENTFI